MKPSTKGTVIFAAISASAVAALASIPGSAFALNSAADTAVTSAFNEGATSVGLVVSGVILVAGTVTVLSLVYKWLTK